MARPRTRPRDLFGRLIPKRRGRNAEGQIQIAIVEFVERCAPQCIIAHFANGGWRTAAEAARFKAMGVKKGMPDLILLMPDERVAFWEVKYPGEEMSDDQQWVAGELLALGHTVAIVTSIEDARAELRHWGIRTKESVA